jgi:ring-1,2-phenylacetyl-CoA epoxidase subunit PaaC
MNDQEAVLEYCLRIGDTSLIAGQRMTEWCGHAPILEEDIALSNIALDMIGQARIMYDYAARVEGKGRTEDDLAFLRDARQFRNFLLAELPNGDFAMTSARQYLLSVFNFYLYTSLVKSKDSTIAAFAQKSLKEVAYHVRHFSDWVLRLGDGTEESHTRLQNAVNELWSFVDDLFVADAVDAYMLKTEKGADIDAVKQQWTETVNKTFTSANIVIPQVNNFLRTGSRQGNHTEHLGYILAEMQFLPRAYPDAKW